MTTKIKYILGILIVVLFCGILLVFQEYMADKKREKYIHEIVNFQGPDVVWDITAVVNFRPQKVFEQKVFQLKAEEKQALLNTLVEVLDYDIDDIIENVAINIMYTYKINIRKNNSFLYLELPIGVDDRIGMSYRSDRLGYGVININAKGTQKLENTLSNILKNRVESDNELKPDTTTDKD